MSVSDNLGKFEDSLNFYKGFIMLYYIGEMLEDGSLQLLPLTNPLELSEAIQELNNSLEFNPRLILIPECFIEG